MSDLSAGRAIRLVFKIQSIFNETCWSSSLSFVDTMKLVSGGMIPSTDAGRDDACVGMLIGVRIVDI